MDKECFTGRCIVMPFSPGGLGTPCTANTDCDSGTCGAGPDGMKCTMTCTVGQAGTCPAGLDCIAASGSTGACWPPAKSAGGGCCDASGAGAPTALLGFALCGLVLRRRRASRGV